MANSNDVFVFNKKRLSKADTVSFIEKKMKTLDKPFFVCCGPDANGEVHVLLCGNGIQLEKNMSSRRSKDQLRKIEFGVSTD